MMGNQASCGVVIVVSGTRPPNKPGHAPDNLSENESNTRNILLPWDVNTRGKCIIGLIKFIKDKQFDRILK